MTSLKNFELKARLIKVVSVLTGLTDWHYFTFFCQKNKANNAFFQYFSDFPILSVYHVSTPRLCLKKKKVTNIYSSF